MRLNFLATLRGEWLLVMVTLLAALGWWVSKMALADFAPATFLAIRFMGSGLLFLPYAWRDITQLSLHQWYKALLVGLAFSANIFLWIQAVAHSTFFGEGAFLLSLSMLIAPLLSWFLFNHRPAPILWLCLLIAAVGLYFLNPGKSLWHMSLGSVLFAASSLSGSLFFVLNNQLSRHLPTLALTTIQVSTAGLVCVIYAFIFESWHTPTLSGYIWLLLSIILMTNARYLIQTHAQTKCPIGNAAMIMVLEPVWTVLLSLLLLGETFTWQKAIGGGLIIFAIMLYRLPHKKITT